MASSEKKRADGFHQAPNVHHSSFYDLQPNSNSVAVSSHSHHYDLLHQPMGHNNGPSYTYGASSPQYSRCCFGFFSRGRIIKLIRFLSVLALCLVVVFHLSSFQSVSQTSWMLNSYFGSKALSPFADALYDSNNQNAPIQGPNPLLDGKKASGKGANSNKNKGDKEQKTQVFPEEDTKPLTPPKNNVESKIESAPVSDPKSLNKGSTTVSNPGSDSTNSQQPSLSSVTKTELEKEFVLDETPLKATDALEKNALPDKDGNSDAVTEAESVAFENNVGPKVHETMSEDEETTTDVVSAEEEMASEEEEEEEEDRQESGNGVANIQDEIDKDIADTSNDSNRTSSVGSDTASAKETVSNESTKLSIPQVDTANQPTTATPPKPPKYILYRSIGNDLPPRHAVGQSYNNVKFILENELNFPRLEKRWLLNRIFNKTEEKRIIGLLDSFNQKYIRMPIVLEEYAEKNLIYEGYGQEDILHSDYYLLEATPQIQASIYSNVFHNKNLYVMNNNGARNRMLEDGIAAGAKWILPFDGNCFLTAKAWAMMLYGFRLKGNSTKYFYVPMVRMANNSDLFDPNFKPRAVEEPQVIFRFDAKERFNENMRYGRRPKVELLWRLQVPGPWDSWPQSLGPWEKKAWVPSTDISGPGSVPRLSYISRLFSGVAQLEVAGSMTDRGLSRSEGVELMLSRVEEASARRIHGYSWDNLMAYNETILEKERDVYITKTNAALNARIDEVINCAVDALRHGPFSVVHKSQFPPSHNKHDYYTPSPYYWPNPDTSDGLPYIRKDGYRIPGTELYDEESERYDRSRLASFMGNTTCLSLAWYFTGNKTFADKGATLVRSWFLDPSTRMRPHMRFAQIQWGHHNNVGVASGIIETKDFYFVLDGIRLLYRSKAISNDELEDLRDWLRSFSQYLLESKQGFNEYSAHNNHGLYFDIQLASLASFLDDYQLFYKHTELAKGRILAQFAPDGQLPHELIRVMSLHYQFFTMQGWITLARIASNAGIDLWRFTREAEAQKDAGGLFEKPPILFRGGMMAVPQINSTWTHPQWMQEDMERSYPLYYTILSYYTEAEVLKWAGTQTKDGQRMVVAQKNFTNTPSIYECKGLFNPHDGVQMFWNLGLSSRWL